MSGVFKRTLPPFLMVIFGVILLLIIPNQISEVSDTHAGPRSFPIILATLIIISSIFTIISEFIKREWQNRTSEKSKDKKSYSRVVYVFFALVLWAALLQVLGFLIATLLLMISLMILIGNKKKTNIIVVSILFTAILYSLNNFVIKIYLPEGIFL